MPYALVHFGAAGIFALIRTQVSATSDTAKVLILCCLAITSLASLSVLVRRLHDLDRPGWHAFLLAVPVFNLILDFQLLFEPGLRAENNYGRDPLGPADDAFRIAPRTCEAHGLVMRDEDGCVRCRRAADRRAGGLCVALAATLIFVGTGIAAQHRAMRPPPVASNNAAPQIVVYGTAWCGACKSAQAWLNANGHAYTYQDLEEPGAMEAFSQATKIPPGRVSIPVVGVNGTYRQGFDPGWMQAALKVR